MKKFIVKLTVGEKVFKYRAKTILECFDAFGITWVDVKIKGILEIKFGKEKLEKVLYVKLFKQKFLNKYAKELFARQLTYLLTGK